MTNFGHSLSTEKCYSQDKIISVPLRKWEGFFRYVHIDILKTDVANPHFQSLVRELDYYLALLDGEDHSFYAQYNKLNDIKNCIIVFCDGEAVSVEPSKVLMIKW